LENLPEFGLQFADIQVYPYRSMANLTIRSQMGRGVGK
jgi:hypothetical protein